MSEAPKQPQRRSGIYAVDEAAPLDRALRRALAGASWNEVRRLIETGKVRLDGETLRDPRLPIEAGSELELVLTAPKQERPGELSREAIVHVDSQVVVVNKPSGMSSVPFDDGERGALSQLLPPLLRRRGDARRGSPDVGVVHRIDKETSGLVVFTRTLDAKRDLESQFRFHTVHRRYVAIAHGAVAARTHRSSLVQDRGDGLRGSTRQPGRGQPSITHVCALEALRGATLVECRLETGRTHQIRIHLSEAGHPLLGERVYVRGFAGEQLPAPRQMLHAAELGFVHPTTGAELRFEAPWPADFEAVLRRLR